jgi:hypothetical protein
MRAISFHNIVDRSSGVTRILTVAGRWWGWKWNLAGATLLCGGAEPDLPRPWLRHQIEVEKFNYISHFEQKFEETVVKKKK